MAVVCANCGAQSSSGFFCANCGARLPAPGVTATGDATAPDDQASFEAPSYAASGAPPGGTAEPTSSATHPPHDLATEQDGAAGQGDEPVAEELADEYEDEQAGRPALVAAGVLDLVGGALLFAWFVAGGLYGAGRGAGFGFNFAHEFNVAHIDNFGIGSVGLFTVAVLSVVAGILCLQRSFGAHQVGQGLTVAMATFGLATLVRFMQFQLSIHTRAGWGGFAQLVFLIGLFALTFAGLVAAARPVWEALHATELEEGRLAWLSVFFALTAVLCITLFFPLFHRAVDPNTGGHLGAYFTHHYLSGTFILVLYLLVPTLALLSWDHAFEWGLLGGWSLCLVIDAAAAVITRDAFSSGALTWALALRLAVSAALLALVVVRILTAPRPGAEEERATDVYPEPSTTYTG